MQKKSMFTTRQITSIAVFIALAVLLKSFLSFETGNFRFTFYEIPMVFIGTVFGPVIGGLTGIIVDVLHMLFSPHAFSFNVFTISNMIWAIVPGLILFRRRFSRSRLVISLVIAGIIAFSLNTVGVYQFYGMGSMLASLPYRIVVLFIKLPIQVFVIETLYYRVILNQFKLAK